MQEQFVPVDVARLLISKGFNEPCLGGYNDTETFSLFGGYFGIEPSSNQLFDYTVAAPLLQQAVAWVEKTFKLEINVYSAQGEGKEWYFLVMRGTRASNDVVYTNRAEATINAIVKAIETYSI